jgi:hypothetical protein
MTLNQIVSRMKSLALSHKQLRTAYFGDPWEFDSTEIVYGACFIQQIPGTITREDHLQKFGFRVFFLDRVGVSEDTEGNETEVLSDMSSVAADYLAMLNYYEDDFLTDAVSPFQSVTEVLNDMVSGVYVDITIGVDYLADRCQVPADDVTFETDFDMARTKILTYTATGSEGDSFTVTGLAGTTVLAIYRGGTYRRAITTVPTDYDTLRVVGTDLGSNKGISSTTGAVGLITGDSPVANEIIDFLIWSL